MYFAGGFRHHPLGVAGQHRRGPGDGAAAGDAGSNTAADHLVVLDRALSQIPDRWRSKNALIRADWF